MPPAAAPYYQQETLSPLATARSQAYRKVTPTTVAVAMFGFAVGPASGYASLRGGTGPSGETVSECFQSGPGPSRPPASPTEKDAGGARYAEAQRQLRAIRNLPRGWDSYDAEPPSPAGCDAAQEVLAELRVHQMPLDFITPTSDGSILLKHRAGWRSVTWEIDDDEEIGVMIEHPGSEPEFRSLRRNQMSTFVAELAWA